jgi:predicted SAM-dependent methyltransferase
MPVREKPLMLNLGCGDRTHEAWVNIDHSLSLSLKSRWFIRPFIKSPNSAGYLHHDLRRGIPFPDGSADVVYSSHLLEHLRPDDALPFLREAYRVLKSDGLLRIVVPDLEKGVSSYVEALRACRLGRVDCPDSVVRLEWATISLLDQMVRTRPGGEMVRWLRQHRESSMVRNMKGVYRNIAESEDEDGHKSGTVARIVRRLRLWNFYRSGELHRWMYDEVSLRRIFVESGFREVRRVSCLESQIPLWGSYYLDNNPDSSPHQPDSLYMEGFK